MDLWELKKNWDEFGKLDPLWSISTFPDKKGNKWDKKEFFDTGKHEIDETIKYINSLNLQISNERALDFGCGVGRLTQALCRYFNECYGVDIAESMINLANNYNQFGNKCKYRVNTSDDLTLFENDFFDFIYSKVVLQHIREDYSKKYIKEFLRVLRPGGILIFDMPSELIKIPLPDSAYKAEIKPLEGTNRLETGSKVTIPAEVKNISDFTWPGLAESGYKASINLGNHWLDATGKLIINDDGRINIPKSLKPGEKVELQLTVTAPNAPGDYILDLDMVLEGVTWFAQKGSKPSRMDVKVSGLIKQIHSTEPVMEIHCIPKNEVLAIIANSNGKVIDIQPDGGCLGWAGYRYCVTK